MDPTSHSAVMEIDRYIAEGHDLIARAQACRQTLAERGAQEGHLLMAARVVTAMQRVQATMLRQRAALIEVARAPAVVVVARARPWWALIGRRKPEVRLL